VSLKDGFDLTTPSGRLMFQVVGAMCEFERNLIRERVKAGIANAKAKGRAVGRRPVSVDTAALAVMRSQGKTIRECADALGVSRSLVHKTLSFPLLRSLKTRHLQHNKFCPEKSSFVDTEKRISELGFQDCGRCGLPYPVE